VGGFGRAGFPVLPPGSGGGGAGAATSFDGYINANVGNNANPGTAELPLQTIPAGITKWQTVGIIVHLAGGVKTTDSMTFTVASEQQIPAQQWWLGRGGDSTVPDGGTVVTGSVAAAGLFTFRAFSKLQSMLLLPTSGTGYGFRVRNGQNGLARDVSVSGGQHGAVYESLSHDGFLTEQCVFSDQTGNGIRIRQEAAGNPSNYTTFLNCEVRRAAAESIFYDSGTEPVGGGGKSIWFFNQQVNAPLTAGMPCWAFYGGHDSGAIGGYNENSATECSYVYVRRGNKGVGNGRLSENLSFQHQRLHGAITLQPYYDIDEANSIEILWPDFDTGGTPPGALNPFVKLGPSTKGCTVRIGVQTKAGAVDPALAVIDQGVGNDVQVWSDAF
jgi:hypothetical protein